jgi:hypothetical protein
VIVAEARRPKRNLKYSTGKRLDTRKKPHVIYVALKVYSIPN